MCCTLARMFCLERIKRVLLSSLLSSTKRRILPNILVNSLPGGAIRNWCSISPNRRSLRSFSFVLKSSYKIIILKRLQPACKLLKDVFLGTNLRIQYLAGTNPAANQFSPNNISRSSRVKVMRITKMVINKERKL